MNHLGLLIVAGILGVASIATAIGSQYMQSGSAAKFWVEKILSRSLGFAALLMLVIFGVKIMS